MLGEFPYVSRILCNQYVIRGPKWRIEHPWCNIAIWLQADYRQQCQQVSPDRLSAERSTALPTVLIVPRWLQNRTGACQAA
jgi:hypothetical protein